MKFATEIYDITHIGLLREAKYAKGCIIKKIGPGPKVGRKWS